MSDIFWVLISMVIGVPIGLYLLTRQEKKEKMKHKEEEAERREEESILLGLRTKEREEQMKNKAHFFV
jgi:uncharacterized membrane protein SpoIIM required for sporulation